MEILCTKDAFWGLGWEGLRTSPTHSPEVPPNWKEHPIPDNPTAINPINTPTPVVTEPNLVPTQMPTSMINIQNAPNVPDPQGYNRLVFRDFLPCVSALS